MDNRGQQSLADQLHAIGLNDEDVRKVLARATVMHPATFEIPCTIPTIRDKFQGKIRCEQGENGQYFLASMVCTLHPKRHIEHTLIEGLDTLELEKRMLKINWDGDATLTFLDKLTTANGNYNDLEREIGAIFKDVQYLMLHRDSKAAGISLQLQHKFWFGSEFGDAIGMDRSMPAFNPVIIHSFDLTRQQFTLHEAYELLNFHPVCKEVVSSQDSTAKMWFMLNPRTFDNTGQSRLSVYPYFPLLPLLMQVPSKTLQQGLVTAERRLHRGSQHLVMTNASRLYRMTVDPALETLIFYSVTEQKLTLNQLLETERLKPPIGEHVKFKWHKKLFGKDRALAKERARAKEISPK